jgi:hypothetical protein
VNVVELKEAVFGYAAVPQSPAYRVTPLKVRIVTTGGEREQTTQSTERGRKKEREKKR